MRWMANSCLSLNFASDLFSARAIGRDYTFDPPEIRPKPEGCIAIVQLLRQTADEIEEEYTPVRRDATI